jgi:hypothetical protein
MGRSKKRQRRVRPDSRQVVRADAPITEVALSAFAEKVNTAVAREIGHADGCILATAVALEALRRLGYPQAKPHGVSVWVCTPDAVRALQSGQREFRSTSEIQQVGGGGPYAGHVGVELDGWWIDPTIGQTRPPGRGFSLPSTTVLPIGAEILASNDDRRAGAPLPGGLVALYGSDPQFRFRGSPGWTDESRIERLAQQVAEATALEWDRLGVTSIDHPSLPGADQVDRSTLPAPQPGSAQSRTFSAKAGPADGRAGRLGL